MVTRLEWTDKFLERMGLVPTVRRRTILVGWITAENTKAAWNPLADTFPMPGSTDYNSVGVQNYVSWVQGLKATQYTLGLSYYTDIVDLLTANAKPLKVADAIAASVWGTGDAIYAGLANAKQNWDTISALPIPEGA